MHVFVQIALRPAGGKVRGHDRTGAGAENYLGGSDVDALIFESLERTGVPRKTDQTPSS